MSKISKKVLLTGLIAFSLILPSAVLAQSDVVAPTPSATATSTSSSSFSSLSDFKLIPPCMRTADQATTAGISCVIDSIKYYTNMLLVVVAAAAFIYMLYGAFLYVSAFGDENKIKQAKKTITYALAGIVLATLAYALVALLSSILGVSPPS